MSNTNNFKMFDTQAVDQQKAARAKFEALSETGKSELTEFKSRRVTAFRKNLIELGEIQVKHSKVNIQKPPPRCWFMSVIFLVN